MNVTAPPQVVRRDDGSFFVLNVDLDQLSMTQRVGLGVLVWDQVRALMEAAGEYKERDSGQIGSLGIGVVKDIDRATAAAVGISGSSLVVRPRLTKNQNVLQAVLAGEFETIHDIQRALGMILKVRISEGRPSKVKPDSVVYGKGDRFEDAVAPLERYLHSWEKKDFLFTHLNPTEAKRRLQTVEKVLDSLERMREDLTKRSRRATLSAPS